MKHSHLSRRDVLRSLALAASTVVTGSAFAFDTESGPIRLGAQTNAFPIDPRRFDTLLSALSEIRSTGYTGFETGFANLRSQTKSLPQARKQLEDSGLTFLGVHIFLPEYDAQTSIAPRQLYEAVAQMGASLGAQRLILSGSPAVVADEVQRKAEALNQAAFFAQKLGLKVAYHNHWAEFKYGGKEIEALYAATDPSQVWFLLDAGHAFRTGYDIPDFVRRHSARLTGIHFRDFRDGLQVPLGEGTFPLAQVASALKQVRWDGWAINEEERESGAKQGDLVIKPAFTALKGALNA